MPTPSDSSNPAIASIGSTDPPNLCVDEPISDGQSRSAAGRPSDCVPWQAVILTKLEAGLSAQRIYQDLRSEHGFPGSYYSVRRFVRHLDARQELPFRRLECGPGEEAQVDFGTGAPILLPDGKRRRTHVFRIVLSHSRKAYSEAVYRQTTEGFLRCLENAFWHFGGVPQRLVLDNLRAAVSKADWYDPELNPKVRSFGQHYGVVCWPTRPYTPRHKGKVERGVDYVQENALKGRTFASLEEQTGVGKSFLVQALGYQAIKSGFFVLYRSIFDVVRDFLHDEALGGEDKVLARYLKPDLLVIDDMGMKQLPKRSGEYLFEIIMRRYETRSTMMTSNRPLEDWGKLIGDVSSATAILDRFLHHAEIVQITGKSYRLRNQAAKGKEAVEESKPAIAPTGSARSRSSSKPANALPGSGEEAVESKPANAPSGSAGAKEGHLGQREEEV